MSEIPQEQVEELMEQIRFVYGTRTEKWHLVGMDDRDFEHAIPIDVMEKLGPDACKELYLNKCMID